MPFVQLSTTSDINDVEACEITMIFREGRSTTVRYFRTGTKNYSLGLGKGVGTIFGMLFFTLPLCAHDIVTCYNNSL